MPFRWHIKSSRILCACLCFLMLAPALARAQDSGRITLTEENDGILTRDDRHYTQGALLSYLSPQLPSDSAWSHSFDALAVVLPMFASQVHTQRRFEWQIFGQSQFTPDDLKADPPDPHDRPYAAWLYTGFDWLQENDGHSLHSLEVQAGVVGPAALGRQIQDGFHTVFGFNSTDGWDSQLGNRGAFQFSYSYRRRLTLGRDDGYGFDAVPEFGLSLGTVLRYAEAGALLRFGNALGADYGPERIRPSLSGTAFVDARRVTHRYLDFTLFIGAQTRRVFYNRFIDGSREVAPPGLERTRFVNDLVAGGTVWLSPRLRADFTATRRSSEYDGQPAADVFGAASLSLAL
ncbi:MAG: lipid A deacylase LpxR family protein [Stenotrophobium sp.]